MTIPCRITRLTLTDFRSYAAAGLEPGSGPVVLTGLNGAGKTNVLEAVSLLAPGRGLRGAALGELARADGGGGWAVAARTDGPGGAVELGTGSAPGTPDRRVARVNGAPAPLVQFGERLAVAWLTPAMDRLLAEGAGARRRFLDRLTLALEPGHGTQATRYEAAMRERSRLLAGGAADPAWLDALEARMAEHGALLAAARARTAEALQPYLAAVGVPFPVASLAYEDASVGAELAGLLRGGRARDMAAGRALAGPHRADLSVIDAASGAPAARCSTGEQKALLIGVLLAHAELVAALRGMRPILLLDEVAAHLDEHRRSALLERLPALGQVWLTGTEMATFEALRPHATLFTVRKGEVVAA
ncbi:MAG: DNA replication/repair protein RecF [Sphingomonadaceae bacterium]|nr:DNA replication/repair protein RecF [Sphingomonadaceae bacterium]